MRFCAQYPMPAAGGVSAADLAGDIAVYAKAAEDAGFDGIAFTEHPAPSRKWMEGGGHSSLDPYAALSYVAAITSRIRLVTFLVVLPYRNPMSTAKAAISVDVLSNGRLTLTCGTGYLRSEFGALGVDFDERNELFDEALEVLNLAWTNPDGVAYEGKHFKAKEQSYRPAPIQERAPLWIGGNSSVAKQRVAKHAVGWAPMLADPTVAQTSRTPAITSIEELADHITDVKDRVAAAGRDPTTIDICGGDGPAGGVINHGGDWFNAEESLDWIGRMTDIGVTWINTGASSMDQAANLEALAAYGEAVIAKSR
jgi:probable F420-dependent oxidoreductase